MIVIKSLMKRQTVSIEVVGCAPGTTIAAICDDGVYSVAYADSKGEAKLPAPEGPTQIRCRHQDYLYLSYTLYAKVDRTLRVYVIMERDSNFTPTTK